MAAKAVAFTEALEFGKDYAKQVIKNAKALAQEMSSLGFKVLGESRGFTKSHQIAINVLEYSDGGKAEHVLEKANISKQKLYQETSRQRNYFQAVYIGCFRDCNLH